MSKITPVFLATLLWGCGVTQKNTNDDNKVHHFVAIKPGSTETDIIRVAANVTPSARQIRWQELEFVAFLHFGINTFTGREWGTGTEDEKIFNPTQLDARQWVRTCKEAGMKQVIITAKHHDGFCLWPTKLTEHSVKNSPWKDGKGDVVKEVADACRELGMGFGVYLSPWDRNSPVYGDSPAYNALFMGQLTELLTQYGKVDEVWFDGANGEGPNGKKQVYDWNAYHSLIRKLQPTATIAIMGPDIRWVGTESGYGRNTEWSVVPYDRPDFDSIAAASQQDVNFVPQPNLMNNDLGSRAIIKNAKGLMWYPAETDVSIRPGWFYHASEDEDVKSPEKLFDIYFNSVGLNGVLLLNIPPDKRGLIHENDVKALQGFRALKDKMYKENYARGAELVTTGKNVDAILDGNNTTHWTTKNESETGSIIFKLPAPKTISVLSLQENIRVGQRIEKFSFEYLDGTEWKKIAEGTTVGYKRLLRFAPVTAKEFRINIEGSRLNPTLSEVGFYKNPLD
ncbi:alpha-L-fucosidase [Chitinophaga sp. MM2321]|uniref:alpha-L-fucosidase n=1 Tax=Chitinophaga sp. MM2321 TaxID=3137178 RepID=UPI0032D5A529